MNKNSESFITGRQARKQVNEAFYAEDPNQLENVKEAILAAIKDKKFFATYNYRLTPKTRKYLDLHEYEVGAGYESVLDGNYEIKIRW